MINNDTHRLIRYLLLPAEVDEDEIYARLAVQAFVRVRRLGLDDLRTPRGSSFPPNSSSTTAMGVMSLARRVWRELGIVNGTGLRGL